MREHALILDTVLPTIRKDLGIPGIPFKPAVLDNLYPSATIPFERFKDRDVVCVADSDVFDFAGVL